MHYDLVSRSLAYISCMTTMSLFVTSMAIAAVNVGPLKSSVACMPGACPAAVAVTTSKVKPI